MNHNKKKHFLFEVSLEKLGLSRAARSERLRAAAETGDARRVAALLEAGADVDAENARRPETFDIKN